MFPRENIARFGEVIIFIHIADIDAHRAGQTMIAVDADTFRNGNVPAQDFPAQILLAVPPRPFPSIMFILTDKAKSLRSIHFRNVIFCVFGISRFYSRKRGGDR